MYKILGTDNKEYGPVSAEQLRQWIVEGRANRSTLAQDEGATSWKPLSLFPEFSGTLAGAPPTQPAPRPVASVSNGTNGLAVTSLVFGIVALAQLKSSPEQAGRGMAWTGLALSTAVFLLFGCLLLFGVFAGQIEKWLR